MDMVTMKNYYATLPAMARLTTAESEWPGTQRIDMEFWIERAGYRYNEWPYTTFGYMKHGKLSKPHRDVMILTRECVREWMNAGSHHAPRFVIVPEAMWELIRPVYPPAHIQSVVIPVFGHAVVRYTTMLPHPKLVQF